MNSSPRGGVAIALLLLCAAPVHAQVGDNAAAWAPEHRAIADRIGTYAVYGQIGADVLHDWRSDNRKRAFCESGVSIGLTAGTALALKALITEPRPNGVNNRSMPSLHTGFAVSASSWSFTFGLPIAAVVGESRVWSNWHHDKDVWAGMAIGAIGLVAGHYLCESVR